MLRRWKEKNGMKATYRKLANIFASQGRRNLAEKLCKLMVDQSSDENISTAIMRYGDHLRGVYQTELSYSLDTSDFLPSQTCTVFNLALIGHDRIQYGTEMIKHVQEILNSQKEEEIKEVKLENIFKSGQPGR